ncbi:MAG: hypothetical protein NWE88_12750 [Candidatus Bathyarchaeota archaeon]|nr:hypothetical protein [Candidatus Bathyarchaeota archaeon]
MVKKKEFTEADKKRLMQKESETYGKIRKDSLAVVAQRQVDKRKSKTP